MKKFLNFQNIILVLAMVLVGVLQGPQIFSSFSQEGKLASPLSNLKDIHGQKIELNPPYALVFWATWCGPCEFELSRLQGFVDKNPNLSNKILTIAIANDSLDAIHSAINSRGYKFNVVWDQDNTLSRDFSVQGTPTVVVVDKSNAIQWVTMGLSPLLKLRLSNYLSP